MPQGFHFLPPHCLKDKLQTRVYTGAEMEAPQTMPACEPALQKKGGHRVVTALKEKPSAAR
jgi:hypothetical protein